MDNAPQMNANEKENCMNWNKVKEGKKVAIKILPRAEMLAIRKTTHAEADPDDDELYTLGRLTHGEILLSSPSKVYEDAEDFIAVEMKDEESMNNCIFFIQTGATGKVIEVSSKDEDTIAVILDDKPHRPYFFAAEELVDA